MRTVVVEYRFFKKPGNVILVTGIAVLLYQGFYYLRPGNLDWISDPGFDWLNLLRFLLIDQVLIESVTIGIIFISIRYYARWLGLNDVGRSLRKRVYYFLMFLPLFLSVYFLFSPFTCTLRYLLHLVIYDASLPYSDYFFLRIDFYLTYLIPVLLIGYSSLFINFLMARTAYSQNMPGAASLAGPPPILQVKDEIGQLPIALAEIHWIKKEARKNMVKTNTYTYFTNRNLSTLEKELKQFGFIRINRAVIVPVSNIRNYSFWKNEKYMLRTKDGSGFIMSRDRLKKLRAEGLIC